MKRASIPKDQFFFSGSDCRALLKKNRRFYLRISSFVLLSSLLFNAFKEPRFKSEAKFKKAYDGQDVSSKLKSVLPYFTPATTQVSAASVMKSRSFLKSVVSSLGLQAHVKEEGFLQKKVSSLFDNISSEMGRKIPAKDRFIFKDVVFEEIEPEKFYLLVKDDFSFELLSSKGEAVVCAKIGQRISLPQISFTLQHIPKGVHEGKKYPLIFHPWEGVVKGLQKKFMVKEDKSDKDVLVLTASLSDPLLSASFLDFVMKRHVEYVKEESATVLQDHLEYFEGRKKDLESQYTEFLEEHVAYLKDNLQTDGFMGLRQEVAALEKPSEEYHSKLYDVELELSRLRPVVAARAMQPAKDKDANVKQAKDKEEKVSVAKNKIEPLSQKDLEKLEQRQQLHLPEKMSASFIDKRKQVEDSRSEILAFTDSFLQRELSRIGKQKQDTEALLASLGKSGVEPAAAEHGEMLKKSLQELLLSLDLKEKEIIDRHASDQNIALELEGLTPENAQQLYLDYNRELDSVYLTIRQLGYLQKQIFDPDIELSSLCNLLTDPVSQQMIQRAAQMALELRDDSNRSTKEHERIKDSLTLQKNFLSHHVMQMIDLQKMRAKLIEEKIVSLQSSSVHLLSTEKDLIEQRLLALRNKMSDSLPIKWKMENQLQLKKELFIRMIEGVAHLEESKRVDQNILPSSYKVLDPASLPRTAEKAGIVLYPAMLCFFASFTLFGFSIFRRAMLGSPVSMDLLKHYDVHCSGHISALADTSFVELKQKDLETIRKLSHFISQQRQMAAGLSVCLFGKSQANYTKNLAEVLSLKGAKVLLIDALFPVFTKCGQANGLRSFLLKEVDSPSIAREGSYDFIASGGYVRNYIELISQPVFFEFIEKKKREYDFVIIHTEAIAGSSEAIVYQSLADICIVSAGFEDSIENFTHFTQWQEERNKDCLSFVLREA